MSPTPDPAARSRLLHQVTEAETRLHTVSMRSLEPLPLPADLTLRQLQVLALVRHTPGLTGQEIAAALGVSTATTSGLVDRIATKGWVEREHDPADRRRVLLRLSARAERMLSEIEEPARRARRRVLDRLTDQELEDLARLLRRMYEIARETVVERR